MQNVLENRPQAQRQLPDVTSVAMEPEGFPFCITPATPELRVDGEAAADWVRNNKGVLDGMLTHTGAILFRGFALGDSAAFDKFLSAYPDHGGGYAGGTSPRATVSGRVMESTHAPPDRVVPIHQEMAYAPIFPLKIAFYCEQAPSHGGETPICDMRALERRLPRPLSDGIRERGLQYRRHFRSPHLVTGVPELDIVHRTWQQAFQTEDPAEAERQALDMGSKVEWLDSGMIVSNSSPGFTVHPATGESIWFNAIGGFSFSFNRSIIGERLGTLYEQHYVDGRPLPYWTTYGDGEIIRSADLLPLHEATNKTMVSIPWQNGDVILLDNILAGHGRNTFEGARTVRVVLLA